MNLRRRDLLKSAGVVVAFSWSAPAVFAQQAARPALPGSLGANRMLDGWIRINPAGTITVFTGKCELGQGIVTALAQIAAEELDVAYERVEMVSADTARTPNEGMTAGSLSVENSGTALRLACAEARQILLERAAAKLGVGAASLTVADGTVTGSGKKVTYWELAHDANLNREATAKAQPKPPAQHTIVGRSIPRRDIPAKMTGGAAFVQDLRLPGMLHGRVVRPPRHGARLESFDESKVKAMPGVVAVVRDGSFLGVVAQREEQAINARLVAVATAQWSGGSELPDPAKVYEQLMSLRSEDRVIAEKEAPVPAGAKVIEATYHRPYLAHASIAPSCAMAELKDGKLSVWTHSQGVFPLRATLARALGLPPGDIRCIHAEGAGCYGHNGADDVAFDAAVLARAVDGRPVRLQWMRDDEFKWEPYGPAMTMKVKGAVAGGRVVDWAFDVWSQSHNYRPGDADGVNLLGSWYLADAKRPGPARHAAQPNGAGDRNAITLYDFPRQRTTHHLIMDNPVRTSALRSLGAYANVFAIESFMDELAAAAGIDPVAFRLAHIKDERERAVVEAVAKAAAWQSGEKGDGRRGRGIGYARYKTVATYAAVIAEVEVNRTAGTVKVPRIWTSADAGQIINPDGLTNQIEGGVIQSASWTLHEQVRFDRNGILSQDWSNYPILTMPDVPSVETVLIDRPNERALGAGEAVQGPTAAAIANAFAAATGRRIRELPLTPERVKAALA
ncbi:MAG TPA: molybdopterin cofactor-binding domain-containing protein [Gammaproteobacteria bacterium]|nr:molybdopterin cofactor-binding domain-containing protein [Gammaproteobacteria bacterium]